MTILCTRCSQPIDCGHRCRADDDCPMCGTARMVIVETKDECGTLSVVQPCERCNSLPPSAADGLTGSQTHGSKKEV